MHTWAKRGLQTALVTGGLLMLGTGIASAEENVDPDRPASPIDASVSVPMHIANNVVGTPMGQKTLPGMHHDTTVSTDDVTGVLPKQAQQAAAPVTKDVTSKAAPIVNKASSQVLGHDVFRGNRVNADLVVPVDISGNAIAAAGPATVVNDSQQTVDHDRPVMTNGSHEPLSGNVVDADWAAPVQITGNAVSAFGVSNVVNTSSQEASSTGDIQTNGSRGVISGNLVAPQGSTPVQVTGNAITGVGRATSVNQSDSSASSGGTLQTDGNHGVLAGNAGGAPFATPVEVNGNPVAGLGHATTLSSSSADATAGDVQEGPHHEMAYILTNGDPAVGSGSIVQPGHAGPVSANCNAAAGLGTADCTGDSTTNTNAGGGNETTGHGSVGSGTIVAAPTANPAEVFGNAAAAGGKATSTEDNEVNTNDGGANYTNGNKGVASGSLVTPSAGGPVDVFANAGAGAGKSTASTTNNSNTNAGGSYNGTAGSESLGGGNSATAPVAVPGEVFGNGAAGAGSANTSAKEQKLVTSGGTSNTDDDAGTLAANLVHVPVAGAAQVFGNDAGAVGNTDAQGDTYQLINAGGWTKSKGQGGKGAGNIAQVPVSIPAQVFGNGANAGGKGQSESTHQSTMNSGGTATSDGSHGLLTGNIASGPASGAAQVFGASAGALGKHDADVDDVTDGVAGGDVTTAGTHGVGAGNVVSPQALPIAQVFGDSAGAAGHGTGSTYGETGLLSGGDIATNGDHGFISGNLASVPAAAAPQPFGDAVGAVGGLGATDTVGYTEGTVGGAHSTSGQLGSLSGLNGQVPVGAHAPIYDVPLSVLGKAFTNTTHGGGLHVGERDPQLFVPVDGAGLGATQLPRIPAFPYTPMRSALPAPSVIPGLNAPEGVPFGGDLAQLPTGSLPGVGNLPTAGLPGTDALPTAGLPGLDGLPTAGLPGLDGLPTAGLPGVDGVLNGGLPGTRSMPAPGLPVVGNLPTAGLPGVGALPTAGLPGMDALPTAGLPGVGALPTAGLPGVGALPTAGLPGTDALPTAGVPGLGALPVAAVPGMDALPTAELPAVGSLPVGTGIPAIAPGEPTGVIPAVPALPGLDQADLPTAQLPVIGQGVPTLPAVGDGVPSLPGLDQADLPTAQLPVIGQGVPALPGADLPTAELPVVGKPAMPLPTPVATPALPVNAVPAMATLPMTAVPALPAATPALSTLDTDSVIPADQASLADTAAKLQALFGQLPSATSLPMA